MDLTDLFLAPVLAAIKKKFVKNIIIGKSFNTTLYMGCLVHALKAL